MSKPAPEFFHAVQRLAVEHRVGAFAVVALVTNDEGGQSIGAIGGSKLAGTGPVAQTIYERMTVVVTEAIERLSDDKQPSGLLN